MYFYVNRQLCTLTYNLHSLEKRNHVGALYMKTEFYEQICQEKRMFLIYDTPKSLFYFIFAIML
jgi:hypothetical protein